MKHNSRQSDDDEVSVLFPGLGLICPLTEQMAGADGPQAELGTGR